MWDFSISDRFFSIPHRDDRNNANAELVHMLGLKSTPKFQDLLTDRESVQNCKSYENVTGSNTRNCLSHNTRWYSRPRFCTSSFLWFRSSVFFLHTTSYVKVLHRCLRFLKILYRSERKFPCVNLRYCEKKLNARENTNCGHLL